MEPTELEPTTPGAPAAEPSGPPLFSAIIPVFNSFGYLQQSLPAVVAAMDRHGRAEMILVDNGSSDGSYEFMKEHFGDRAAIIQIPGVTIAALRNHGARMARGEFLSFIDSDCLVPPGYFDAAEDVFRTIGPDATGCEYDRPQDAGWLEATWHDLHWRSSDGYVPYLYSGNFLIRRSVFHHAGGFDESLVTGEDAEIGLRLTSLGHAIYRTARVPAVHLGNAKTIRSFLRKQVWHSLGMFGSVHVSWFDKTLLMTMADLALLIASVGMLFVREIPWKIRVLGFVLAIVLVPMLTVTYRWRKKGSVYRPLRSIFLYRMYFAARIFAFCQLLVRRWRRTAAGARAP
jgi:glycosyltransferase involved in cell wall biosynthesis